MQVVTFLKDFKKLQNFVFRGSIKIAQMFFNKQFINII